MHPSLHVSLLDQVAYVTFNNPPRNTLTMEILDSWTHLYKDFGSRPAVDRPRAIMLQSGIPGVFGHGMDPEVFVKADQKYREDVFISLSNYVVEAFLCGIPTLALVEGPALAGGAVIAGGCDFTLMKRGSKICYSEVKVGLPIPAFMYAAIQMKVQPSAMLDVALLGKNFEADEAVRIGLACKAYDTDSERDEYLKSLLGRIRRIAPDVAQATLRDSRKHIRGLGEDFKRDYRAGFARFLGPDYLVKGLTAVLRGQSPVF